VSEDVFSEWYCIATPRGLLLLSFPVLDCSVIVRYSPFLLFGALISHFFVLFLLLRCVQAAPFYRRFLTSPLRSLAEFLEDHLSRMFDLPRFFFFLLTALPPCGAIQRTGPLRGSEHDTLYDLTHRLEQLTVRSPFGCLLLIVSSLYKVDFSPTYRGSMAWPTIPV